MFFNYVIRNLCQRPQAEVTQGHRVKPCDHLHLDLQDLGETLSPC